MLRFTLSQVAQWCRSSQNLPELPVDALATDTRLPFRPNTVFVALDGPNHQGGAFLAEAFSKGALAAVCRRDTDFTPPEGGYLIPVADPLEALHLIAAAHRQSFDAPLLAITGSNGKTMLKDLLATLLTPSMTLHKSPGSFNSYVGIALSLLGLKPSAELALIEVGVSAKGEMEPKAAMVKPTLGVLTNVGLAHFEGFGSRRKIASEKMKLFGRIPADGWVLLPDDPLVKDAAAKLQCRVYYLGREAELPSILSSHNLGGGTSALKVAYPDGRTFSLTLPLDYAFQEVFETILAGLSAAHLLGIAPEDAIEAARHYHPPMGRLEVWKSSMGSIIINDAYSADPVSTGACLRVFAEYPGRRKVFVFGGMLELGDRGEYEHRIVAEELARQRVDVLLTVGEPAKAVVAPYLQHFPEGRVHSFDHVAALADFAESFARDGDVIAVKGPRGLNLEQLSVRFKARLTQSVYYIDLARIRENLVSWRQHLSPNTRVLVMIKALAYGADAVQIASFLQAHVDFFGVAYAKEAIALRQNGISADILVQLVLPEDCEDVVRLNLQPVILEGEVAELLSKAAVRLGKTVRVHLEVDTGMGRFGVFPEKVTDLARRVEALPGLDVAGLMTHFSSADDPAADAFTRQQIDRFKTAAQQLADVGIRPPLLHAAATAAAARFPEAHFDMVRIGLGIHGIYPSPAVADALRLKCPLALVSKVGSIKAYPKGYPISYNRTFITSRASRIAYLPIGYHDGLSRRWGKGWSVVIRGRKAPIVGAVCMDFTPVDITDIEGVAVGDEALIFGEWHGEKNPVEDLARLEGTIPYEVLCRLSDRIQRIYRLDEG